MYISSLRLCIRGQVYRIVCSIRYTCFTLFHTKASCIKSLLVEFRLERADNCTASNKHSNHLKTLTAHSMRNAHSDCCHFPQSNSPRARLSYRLFPHRCCPSRPGNSFCVYRTNQRQPPRPFSYCLYRGACLTPLICFDVLVTEVST